MNRELTDKTLRVWLVAVKTDAKPGQTKQLARNLAVANAWRTQIFRIDLRGEKEEFKGPLFKLVKRHGFRPGGTVME